MSLISTLAYKRTSCIVIMILHFYCSFLFGEKLIRWSRIIIFVFSVDISLIPKCMVLYCLFDNLNTQYITKKILTNILDKIVDEF